MNGSALPDFAALVRITVPEDLPALAGRLREAELLVEMRLRAGLPPSPAAAVPEVDGNTSVAEAARRLGVSASYLYKNARSLPFMVRIGRRRVCSLARLERWNRARIGA